MNCLIISIFNFDYKIFISFNSIILFDYYEITFFYFPLALDKHGERISVSCLTFKYFGRWFNLKSSSNIFSLICNFFFINSKFVHMYMCVSVWANFLLVDSVWAVLLCLTQFLGRWARHLKIATHTHTDNLAFYVRFILIEALFQNDIKLLQAWLIC